ncbi:hypothetical protein [Kutzneria buriramensis]|uniref:ABC-2 family transporter n=1 Tax=Kutzneria buriramensis TaxID=1045776 RepID=A0A3E0IAL0_9PSEU|nr:hypothetical protein [Kutzneria buriramensis]REH55774.1 hypothetical protein BCF44_101800 [Kutzneria buriramensis]
MLWITWRQHRTALIGTLVVTAGVSALLLWMWQAVAELNDACSQHDCITGVPGALGDQLRWVYASLYFGQPILAGLVAMFWGAPLLAREFEQRTYLLAWAQDVTPMRWLGSKVALLGAAVLLLSGVLAAASWQLVGAMKESGNYFGMDDFKALEQWPPTQVLYALFAFVLGLAVGLLVRRTVLAIGTTLIVFATVRLVVAFTVLWWVPPLRVAASPQGGGLPPGAYYLSGYGMPYLRSAVLVYQPVERVATFRWLEVITYAVLTLVLAGVAWAGVWRVTRVG